MNRIEIVVDRLTFDIVYETVKAIQRLAWKDDDMMTQETLFDLQEALAHLALELAVETGNETDLLSTFPWLYRREEG